MTHIFEQVKAFIIPLKMSEYEISYYRRLIEKYGGTVCPNQSNANLILTVLKSSTRISRNILNHKIPVCDIQWIKECDKSKTLQSTEKYTIIAPSAAQTKASTSATEILSKEFSGLNMEELQFEDDNTVIDLDDSDEEVSVNTEIAPDFINAKYECLRPTPYEPKFNKKLVSLLLILERKRQLDNDDKRSLSYRHAIAAIKAYPREIASASEAEKINGIGKSMVERIKELIDTGTIEEAELLRSDVQFQTLSLYTKVFGVGNVTANIWWKSGYRTLQEVLDKAKLTSTVRLGIELFPDFNQLMSREDVEEIIDIISKVVDNIDPNCIVLPVGGYRRGKSKNGDLDLLISNRNGSVNGLFNKVLQRLTSDGYLKHRLWHSSELKDRKRKTSNIKLPNARQQFDNYEKCFSAFLQPSKGIHRQVDLIVVPKTDLPLAILGWTGSRQFERSIRDYAKREKGMSLNSQSIYMVSNGKKRRVEVDSEEEVFNILGIPYLEPKFRNC